MVIVRPNTKWIALALATVSIISTATPGFAWERENWTLKNILKHTAVGAGAGAGAGILSDRSSVGRGAGIGAVTGAATGIVDSSRTIRRRPLIKDAGKGAIIGTGAAAIQRESKLKGAAIGAGAGAGWHFLKKWW